MRGARRPRVGLPGRWCAGGRGSAPRSGRREAGPGAAELYRTPEKRPRRGRGRRRRPGGRAASLESAGSRGSLSRAGARGWGGRADGKQPLPAPRTPPLSASPTQPCSSPAAPTRPWWSPVSAALPPPAPRPQPRAWLCPPPPSSAAPGLPAPLGAAAPPTPLPAPGLPPGGSPPPGSLPPAPQRDASSLPAPCRLLPEPPGHGGRRPRLRPALHPADPEVRGESPRAGFPSSSPHCPLLVPSRISLNTLTLNVKSEKVYTRHGVPISVTGIAQVRFLSLSRRPRPTPSAAPPLLSLLPRLQTRTAPSPPSSARR